MAEMKRFELLNGFHHYTLSKRAPSTTRTHLQETIFEVMVVTWVLGVRQLILGPITRSTFFKKLRKEPGALKMFNSAYDRELMVESFVLMEVVTQA